MKVIDQMNRTVSIHESVQRIVSLVPSQTELLIDLGLEDKVIGVTKFCIHPEGLKKEKEIIGGTKNFNFEKIRALKPDLIIGNKEENYKVGIEELEKEFPVWMSDIITIEDSKNMISSIGEITSTTKESDEILKEVNKLLNSLKESSITPKNALYFIWKNPYMVAGSSNYINQMLQLNGYKNICNSGDYSRYPELTKKEITELNPEVILLSSEPFPFKKKHIEEIQKLAPNALISIVDGELYSWYGTRIIKALNTFISNS